MDGAKVHAPWHEFIAHKTNGDHWQCNLCPGSKQVTPMHLTSQGHEKRLADRPNVAYWEKMHNIQIQEVRTSEAFGGPPSDDSLRNGTPLILPATAAALPSTAASSATATVAPSTVPSSAMQDALMQTTLGLNEKMDMVLAMIHQQGAMIHQQGEIIGYQRELLERLGNKLGDKLEDIVKPGDKLGDPVASAASASHGAKGQGENTLAGAAAADDGAADPGGAAHDEWPSYARNADGWQGWRSHQ